MQFCQGELLRTRRPSYLTNQNQSTAMIYPNIQAFRKHEKEAESHRQWSSAHQCLLQPGEMAFLIIKRDPKFVTLPIASS